MQNWQIEYLCYINISAYCVILLFMPAVVAYVTLCLFVRVCSCSKKKMTSDVNIKIASDIGVNLDKKVEGPWPWRARSTSLQWVQRQRPRSDSQGQCPPEAESFLKIGHPKEGKNWWSDCHECHLESFLVWHNTEESFIIGVNVAKIGGSEAWKPWSLKIAGSSSLAASQKSTPMASDIIVAVSGCALILRSKCQRIVSHSYQVQLCV